MKAAIYTEYGSPRVLEIADVAKPIPKSNEVLIRVYATTVNRTDCGFRSAKYFVSRFVTGLLKPRRQVAGSEFAGEVVEVGSEVQELKVRDRVFGFEDVRSGAHATYMAVAANGSISKIPAGLSYEEVAPAGEGATYALSVIRAAGVNKGQKVLVYGATGAIGSAAVQILKYLGVEVMAVCGTANVELIASLGADKVVDYQKEDYTDTSDRFDLIFDAVGKTSYDAGRKILTRTGKYCSTELGKGGRNVLLAVWFGILGSRRVIFPIPRINKEKMNYIRQLLEVGAYRPVIDRTYPLEKIVEASKYVESGQKIGNVVMTID
jgi:NADPH:quinone reductase-like Zn-dependent oxidoreductase